MAFPDSDETQLIISAQGGDVSAFDLLVRNHQDLAFRTAWVILRHEQDAQDAAQTAIIKAWGSLSRFRAGEPFRPWLLRIVANEAKNSRDSRWRWYQLQRHISDHFTADGDPLPPALISNQETSDELLEAISLLSENDQQIILVRYALQLSEREMMDILDIPAGTVKSRLHRALNRLKGVLDDDIER